MKIWLIITGIAAFTGIGISLYFMNKTKTYYYYDLELKALGKFHLTTTMDKNGNCFGGTSVKNIGKYYEIRCFNENGKKTESTKTYIKTKYGLHEIWISCDKIMDCRKSMGMNPIFANKIDPLKMRGHFLDMMPEKEYEEIEKNLEIPEDILPRMVHHDFYWNK